MPKARRKRRRRRVDAVGSRGGNPHWHRYLGCGVVGGFRSDRGHNLKVYGYAVVRNRENEIYAERVFVGIVDFDQVLASKQWMTFKLGQLSPGYELGQIGGGGELFCRLAAVNLSSAAGSSPPGADVKQSQLQMKPPFSFVGNWLPTPLPGLESGESSFENPCTTEFGKAVTDRVAAALASEGSWWHGDADAVDGILYVYSKPQNLAVRLYYGD